ncbi:hypothetical protein RFI_20245 [Reticulomyxa filosa]|uniref:Uncharacterized protein n=1 Tax=Reticulomyxa filosa TaxID=46433 RepID=X6MUG1_RETFI|nr:hypothetical protein RFI_20245 [Reticulomyxa filosa]|eukprot:ETO17087.1 hypothetical protein RFI_20245 [Reticulomyxa filosa]
MLDRLKLHAQLRVVDVPYCFIRVSYQTMSEECLQMHRLGERERHAFSNGQIEKFNKENKELQQEIAGEIKKMKEDYEEQTDIHLGFEHTAKFAAVETSINTFRDGNCANLVTLPFINLSN